MQRGKATGRRERPGPGVDVRVFFFWNRRASKLSTLPQLSRSLFPLLRLLRSLTNERSTWLPELKTRKTIRSHGKWIMAVNETISYSIHQFHPLIIRSNSQSFAGITIGETTLNTTRLLLQTFKTLPRRQRLPTNAILLHFLLALVNTAVTCTMNE